MALGVIYIAALASFVVGIAASPGHEFKGRPASLTILGVLVSGLVLAIGAL